MRKMTMIQFFVTLGCLLAFQLASGQTDFIVLTTGDTLKGKIKYLNYGTEKKVQITTLDKKKNTYTLLQTASFRLNNEVYHPMRVTEGYTFMKVLKTGYLSYYAFQLPNQTTWDGRYLRKKDGTGMEVPNIGFKRNLMRYLSECPTLTGKIESGELGKLEIEEIINQYNACIDRNTSMQNLIIENEKDQTEKLKPWTELENSINNGVEFEDKTTALEIINEIKIKIRRAEKVPTFLMDGLKEALKDQSSSIQEALEKALQELQ
jgi:hypothetical protein